MMIVSQISLIRQLLLNMPVHHYKVYCNISYRTFMSLVTLLQLTILHEQGLFWPHHGIWVDIHKKIATKMIEQCCQHFTGEFQIQSNNFK